MAFSYKGAITFGLVYIPIVFIASIKNNDIGFNLIDKKTMSRVKYKKTCVDCDDKEVKNENIVKGYQYEKDKYVIFTDKDFEKIKTKKDKNVTILQFVNVDEVDPIFFDKAYYVKPSGADNAFALLALAMQKQKRAAIARAVLGTKESLILLRVKDGVMLANTLFFNEEVQKPPQVNIIKPSKQEIDLAVNLIEQMTDKFHPEKFKDEYNIKLKKAIKSKISGNDIVVKEEKEHSGKIINLMEALQQSLKQSGNKEKKRQLKHEA